MENQEIKHITKTPDGESYVNADRVDEPTFKKALLEMYKDIEAFYFAIVNTKESKKAGKYIYINPPPERVPYLSIMEAPDYLLTKKERDKIIKICPFDVTDEDKIAIFKLGVIDFIKEYVKSPHIGKYKVSGHLKDQQLKYTYPKDNSKQLSIWDTLLSRTREEIEKDKTSHTTREEIVEGIKLSPSEQKVIDSLCKLLHKGSQTSNPKTEDYYTGNLGGEMTTYSGEQTQAPRLGFTLYELSKEYKGGEAVGGKDVENVKRILQELHNKKFLLSYIETVFKKDGGRIERKIEDFRKLIHILKLTETEYNSGNIEMSKKEESIILLNPIFRRQIDSKFILYPEDITKRTIIAYGSHNVSDITLRLRERLMREHASKHYKPEIMLDRLYYALAEKWMGEGRKKKVKEYTEKALETCIALGLLQKYEILPSSTGEPKIVFHLNKRWG